MSNVTAAIDRLRQDVGQIENLSQPIGLRPPVWSALTSTSSHSSVLSFLPGVSAQ
jgi:hypothetical protein